MKSMLFAAGLGTRLQPLTNDRPKAMVEVKGKPLLQWAIERLKAAGSEEIIINVHHFAHLIVDFLKSKNDFGIRIAISDEREMILETGGGLKKAQWFFDDGKPFIVCNVDIFTNLNFQQLYEYHLNNNAIATLAVRDRPTSRYLIFDENNKLVGWKNEKTGEIKSYLSANELNNQSLKKLAFSGIHVLSPKIFDFMPTVNKYSIIETYLKAMETENLIGYIHNDDFWFDVGKPASLEIANKYSWL